MKRVEDYFENTENNNRMIQKALREADMGDVVDLCVFLGEESQLILRNMSERACEELNKTLEAEKGKIPEHAMRRAYASFQKKLLKYEDKISGFSIPEDQDRLDFSSNDSLRASLLTVHKLNAQGRVEELNDLVEGIDAVRIKKMMKLILHDCDPLKAEALMEKQISALVEEYRVKMNRLREGIRSILSEEPLEDLIDILDD